MKLGFLLRISTNHSRVGIVPPALIVAARKFVLVCCCFVAAVPGLAQAPAYEDHADHDPDGIGKFYAGREIAQVMGHAGADWLERPERQLEERPDLLVQSLPLRPGEVAADIGAGTGYLSWRMAGLVGDKGKVYCVDIQQEMLDLLAQKMAEHHTTNFQAVLGTITDTH